VAHFEQEIFSPVADHVKKKPLKLLKKHQTFSAQIPITQKLLPEVVPISPPEVQDFCMDFSDPKKPTPSLDEVASESAITMASETIEVKAKKSRQALSKKQASVKISRKSESKKISGSKIHKCPHCTMTFDKPQGMGGHISKAHPGKSKVYS
jgi:hypothetical protein